MAVIDYNGLILQCQSLAKLVNRVLLLESSDKTDELNLLSLKRLLLTLQKTFGGSGNFPKGTVGTECEK